MSSATLADAKPLTSSVALFASGQPRRAASIEMSKPWGSRKLQPWRSNLGPGIDPVGEIWFEPAQGDQCNPTLLLKLLFTEQKLSVQVHPGDAYARGCGLPNGKSEAWCVLSAQEGAQVALGLDYILSPKQLKSALLDGSIAQLITWRPVTAGDVIFVPAGTIHAIGPGLVLAEIQQRSDATFRMFDYGRDRELHIDQAIAVAKAEPFLLESSSMQLDDFRSVLVQANSFVLERITLPPQCKRGFKVPGETWLLPVAGNLALAELDIELGQAGYMCDGQSTIRAGVQGSTILIAYPGPRIAVDLLVDTSQVGDHA